MLYIFLEVSGVLMWHLQVFEAGKQLYKILRNPSYVAETGWSGGRGTAGIGLQNELGELIHFSVL